MSKPDRPQPIPTSPSASAHHAELRLALVCYGGVSLAVYMHGVTKELHKLVVASRALDAALLRGDSSNPFREAAGTGQPIAGYDSERVYFDALKALGDAGKPLSVAIDIVGGTSAGGINGVVLAKALATNSSQDALRNLWIGEGDLRKLLRTPAVAGLAVQTGLALVWSAATAWRKTSLLRSDVMSRNLLHALTEMDKSIEARSGPLSGMASLIPHLRRLQLFVTTTDQAGFDVAVPSGAGGVSQRDRAYAQVMEFRSANLDPDVTPSGLGIDHTSHLTFAARATSAFPAAFAPVTRSGFLNEVAHAATLDPSGFASIFRYRYPSAPSQDGSAGRRRLVRLIARVTARLLPRRIRDGDALPRRVDDTATAERSFIDGGLLNNAPFDLVIDAIAHEEAHHEVIRRLVYIEPDPGKPLTAAVEAYQSRTRSFAGDLMAIKRPLTSHSYLRDLLHLREMNSQISEIGRIAELQRTEIEADISTRVGAAAHAAAEQTASPAPTTFLDQLTLLDSAQSISNTFYSDAENELSQTWRTYQRMKALSIAERVAQAVTNAAGLPPESLAASAVHDLLSQHMRSRDEWVDGGTMLADRVLKPLDTPYRERRLMFIIDGVNNLYRTDGPDRACVDEVKSALWNELASIQRAPDEIMASLDTADLVSGAVRFAEASDRRIPESLCDRIDLLLTEYRKALAHALPDDNEVIWERFRATVADAVATASATGDGATTLGGGWTEAHFRALAARYLGFSRWDGVLFPIMALSQIPQLSPITTSQFGPVEATTLSATTPGRPELYGSTLAHFGAFLKPGYRESDYLFGRLDGADLILRLLTETTGEAELLKGLATTAMREIYLRESASLNRIPPAPRAWLSRCFTPDATTRVTNRTQP